MPELTRRQWSDAREERWRGAERARRAKSLRGATINRRCKFEANSAKYKAAHREFSTDNPNNKVSTSTKLYEGITRFAIWLSRAPGQALAPRLVEFDRTDSDD
jgi:hypothetical protein